MLDFSNVSFFFSICNCSNMSSSSIRFYFPLIRKHDACLIVLTIHLWSCPCTLVEVLRALCCHGHQKYPIQRLLPPTKKPCSQHNSIFSDFILIMLKCFLEFSPFKKGLIIDLGCVWFSYVVLLLNTIVAAGESAFCSCFTENSIGVSMTVL